MAQAEWSIVKDIFYTALNRPVAERWDFLDSACGDDPALRSEVEFLLESYESGFLETPLLPGLVKKLPEPPLFAAGRQFSHFEIIRMLGRGGMGEVYLATDLTLDRLTAIKVIHGDSGFGVEGAERLVAEARSAARLEHVNICSVYEAGEADGHKFIAMQYVEGDMLDKLIGGGEVTFDKAVSYARQIATALSKAHARGIVHRDIKPSNIIVNGGGHATVLDFGLAMRTDINAADDSLRAAGIIAGTVTYMPPEHVRGQDTTGQTDIWSLGVVFFQMLTGHLPFRGENRADLISAILNDDVHMPADLPPAVVTVLRRALEKDPKQRYATAEEFDADLAAFTTAPVAVRSFGRAAVAAAVILLLIAASGLGVWRYRSANAAAMPFASGDRESYQTAMLYDVKRKSGGVADSLSFSPDGSMITFTIINNGASAIYVQRVAGGESVRIANASLKCFSPVWSPDGQRVAYLDDVDGKIAIRSTPFTGGETRLERALVPSYEALKILKWSNDGTGMFLGSANRLDRADLRSGEITAVDQTGVEGENRGGRFSISPDETRFAALGNQNGIYGLWVKSFDKRDAKRIADGAVSSFQWLGDNHRLVYPLDQGGRYQLFVRDIDGSPQQQITFGNEDIGGPAVSPTGDRIAYISTINEANLYSTDLRTNAETALTSRSKMHLLPAVSPDGKQMAYAIVNDPAKVFAGDLNVETLGSVDTPPAVLTVPNGCCARWSPDGSELIFLRKSEATYNMWKFRVSDRKETQITTAGIATNALRLIPFEFMGFSSSPSPDGSVLAFISKQSGRDKLWSVSTDGTGERMLTDGSGEMSKLSSPQWSPDGQRIAFIESVGETTADQYTNNRINVYGGGHVSVAARFHDWTKMLGWNTAGDHIWVAVKAGDMWDVYLVPANGSGTQRLVAHIPNARDYSLRLSHDQRSIVYSRRVNDIDDLYIVPTAGGEPRRLTANSDPTMYYTGMTWTPDGQKLVYGKQTGALQIQLLADVSQSRK